jgi:hypothetical protein
MATAFALALSRIVPCYRLFPARLSVSGDGDGQMRILMIVAAAAQLMGCAAFAPKADESSDYQASTDRYLACILTNSNDPQQCEVAWALLLM